MEKYKHTCPQCSKSYEDTDPDIYLCPECIEARKVIAQEIDKKFKPSDKGKSQLQELETLAKNRGKFSERVEAGITVSSMTLTTKDLML